MEWHCHGCILERFSGVAVGHGFGGWCRGRKERGVRRKLEAIKR